MRGNNYKILSEDEIIKLENLYFISYEKEKEIFIVKNSTNSRITNHDANKPFEINAKKFGRKLTFTNDIINIYKQAQSDIDMKEMSIIRINNLSKMLRATYQPITIENIKKIAPDGQSFKIQTI